jgi:hypothetical protein
LFQQPTFPSYQSNGTTSGLRSFQSPLKGVRLPQLAAKARWNDFGHSRDGGDEIEDDDAGEDGDNTDDDGDDDDGDDDDGDNDDGDDDDDDDEEDGLLLKMA